MATLLGRPHSPLHVHHCSSLLSHPRCLSSLHAASWSSLAQHLTTMTLLTNPRPNPLTFKVHSSKKTQLGGSGREERRLSLGHPGSSFSSFPLLYHQAGTQTLPPPLGQDNKHQTYQHKQAGPSGLRCPQCQMHPALPQSVHAVIFNIYYS